MPTIAFFTYRFDLPNSSGRLTISPELPGLSIEALGAGVGPVKEKNGRVGEGRINPADNPKQINQEDKSV